MRQPSIRARWCVALVVAAGSFPPLPPRAAGGEILGKVFRGMSRAVEDRHARGPATQVDCSVEQLAGEIDWLEKYIQRYGSIVAKHPDVWGQSRLTRHRVEYEKILAAQKDGFRELNNASLRRSDQSFLGMALALQAAATPGANIPSSDATSSVMNLISTGTNPKEAIPFTRTAPFAATKDSFASFGLDDNNIGLEPTIHLDHLDRYVKHLQELRRINEGDDNGDSPGYALNLVRIPVSVLPGQFTQHGHGAEITVTADLQLGDDLLPTTFRNLVINDLVDTLAPSLTFAANDPETRASAWAEVNRRAIQRTIEQAQAVVHTLQEQYDKLVKEAAEAEAVQNLLAQKVIDALPESVPKLRKDKMKKPFMTPQSGISMARNQSLDQQALGARNAIKSLFVDDSAEATTADDSQPRRATRALEHVSSALAAIDDGNKLTVEELGAAFDDVSQREPALFSIAKKAKAKEDSRDATEVDLNIKKSELAAASRRLGDAAKNLRALRAKLSSASPASIPATKSRRSRLPIPPSQFIDVGGVQQVSLLVTRTYEALNSHPANRPCIDYNDVRGLLSEELQAAYDLLAQPSFRQVWCDLASWNIPELVRTRQINRLEAVRCAFLGQLGFEDALPAPPGTDGADAGPPCCDDDGPCCNRTECHRICRTVTGTLAWMVLVESALLNERLIEDMQTAASSQGRATAPGGAWSGPFYGPDPSPEARRSFNDYVRLRWPIRVFALDPVAQEQNIEDTYSKQREMQIALAVAANGGRLNSQAAMRYARRLETDMATIALNKTAVAFSHGSDTFGWRFYPRFQSPPTRNNIAAFADTLIGSNSQKRDLADRRLEPGIRECTAIIVMPSFVPYVTFDVRTNWFSLNHPQQTDQNMRRTLELSRSVKAMQNSAAHCAQCAGLYRDGEVARLLRRVEQLDRELPLQSMLTQIPYENTSGGFELFNTGVTDLAPELVGWYGAPGIDPDGATTLFLVGKGFSVLDTRVVAGGRLATDVELMSRQVVKVVIPPGVKPIKKPSCASPAAAPCPAVPDTPCPGTAARRSSRPTAGRSLATTAVPRPAVPRSERGPVVTVAMDEVATPLALPPGVASPTALPESVLAPAPSGVVLGAGSKADGGAPWMVGPCPSAADCGPSGTADDATFDQEPDPGCGQDCVRMDYIDVHLVTPYGVSGHLLVPVAAKAAQPDPAPAAGLEFAPQTKLQLFFKKSLENGTAVSVDDFFFVDHDAIAIETPQAFIPPATASIRLTLKDVGDPANPVTVASFSVPAPKFIAASRRYEISGEDLRNFVGDTSRPATDKTLRGGLKPYLDYLLATAGADPLPDGVTKVFEIQAALVADGYVVPIDGTIAVEATPIAGNK